MLDALQNNPIVIFIVVVVLLILIAIPVLLRRQRARQEDVLPPPELGQQVDYTSLPYEEPTSLGDRLRQAPIGVKLLLALVPIVIIIAAVVLWLALFSSPPTVAVSPTATPAPTLSNVTATLKNASTIVVEAETNLPDQTIVTAAMKEGDQDFAWFTEDRATGKVSNGQISISLERSKTAPIPKRDLGQTITLHATVGDQVVSSDAAKVTVPSIYGPEFYHEVAAVPTLAPTVPPTVVPTKPPVVPTAAPVEPTATATATFTATVFNGGNIRPQPQIAACTCPQIHAGEVVTLLERSNDSKWYHIKAPEAEGWVSATLLTVDAEVAKQVPTPKPSETGLTATVAHGGNVREKPVTGRPLDQANAGETVQLLAKTSDGGWYQITTIRNVTGWVSVSLLRIDAAVARQVLIAK